MLAGEGSEDANRLGMHSHSNRIGMHSHSKRLGMHSHSNRVGMQAVPGWCTLHVAVRRDDTTTTSSKLGACRS